MLEIQWRYPLVQVLLSFLLIRLVKHATQTRALAEHARRQACTHVIDIIMTQAAKAYTYIGMTSQKTYIYIHACFLGIGICLLLLCVLDVFLSGVTKLVVLKTKDNIY